MPFTIRGWIEVLRSDDPAEQHAWFGVVDLGSVVDVGDSDSERLFGLSKSYVSRETVDSIAARRGVPANPSWQASRDLDAIADHEKKYRKGEYGAYTHAFWTEIRHYTLTATKPLQESQWKLPFEMARVLEQEFGPDRIRFVVWFAW